MKNVTPYVKATEYAFERLKESTDELRAGLISIITPFYNRIYQVIECIKSVQRQSYQNWELILVNDGSTEDIGEIEKHIALENRVKLINLEKNMGVAHARNTGLNAVTGKFIAFLDSDDTWDPLKLDKQLKFMLENNYCVSHTNYNRVDINGNLLKKVDLSNMAGDIFSYSLFSCGIGTPCVIVDREFWGDLRFPQGIDYGEDICVWLELAWRGEWGHLPEALTSVCVRTDSTYKDTYKQQLGYAEILRYVLKRPRWASYQYEIGILAHDFDNLFPKRKNDESIKSISRWRIIFKRFFNAIRIYGFFGTLKKIPRKLINRLNRGKTV